MAFRRKFRRGKRRSMRKRSYRRRFSRRGTGFSGKRLFKLTITTGVASSITGTISDVWSNNPSGFTEWVNIASLFDEYRVNAVKVKFIPFFPNDDSTQTNYEPLYVCADNNDTTALVSIDQAVQYENFKVFNMYRPWTYYKKFSKLSQVTTDTNVSTRGYLPTSVTTGTQAIKSYGTDFNISTHYGTAIVTAYISAKDRR